jgi:PAS domain S-box-containing protein
MNTTRFEGQTLNDQSEMLSRMIDEFEDYAVILLDRQGNIIHWNKGAALIKGYSEREALGKHFSLFYTAEDQGKNLPSKLLEEAATSGKAVYEGWRVRKDKTRFWGSIVLTALHDDQGQVVGFSKVTRDLSERKKTEDVLKEKNAELESMNQELASFAYVASHDLQEPLRKIQTFLSRIEDLEKDKLTERALDYFRRIQSASSRMQTLIEDLLAYSRTTTDKRKFEPVDLNDVLRIVKKDLNEMITEKNATIESNTLPVVTGVAFQLNQLFTNLLGNSMKFSKPDVPPHIQIKALKMHGADHSDLGFPSDYYHISVRDNGIGFEPAFNAKIFELFQRLHGRSEYDGTGLGLAICKKIIENHGGFIEAHGEKDLGATFNIYLPA